MGFGRSPALLKQGFYFYKCFVFVFAVFDYLDYRFNHKSYGIIHFVHLFLLSRLAPLLVAFYFHCHYYNICVRKSQEVFKIFLIFLRIQQNRSLLWAVNFHRRKPFRFLKTAFKAMAFWWVCPFPHFF